MPAADIAATGVTRSKNVRGSFHFGSRVSYIALAIATIGVGLLVHLTAIPFGTTARDVVGDALWATMMFWWIGALMPHASLVTRSGVSFGICMAVELSQLFHRPALDALRETIWGHLILGSGFDPRDLAAYAGGVAIAAVIDRMVRRPPA